MAEEVKQLKHIWILIRIGCVILIWFNVSFLVAQDDELYDHGLDEKKWNELRDNIRYENQPEGPGREWTYENQQDYQRAQREHAQKNGNGGGSGNNGNGGYGDGDGANERPEDYESDYTPPPETRAPNFSIGNLSWLGYVMIGIFIIALAFLVYYLFINSKRGSKEIKSIHLDDVAPIEIPLTELQRLLQEALANGDYRLAIRIYFVFIVRDLSQKNWIQWEKEKTNYHYLREMSHKPEYEPFQKTVGYFEVIWYGKRVIDKSTFEAIRPDFTNLLDKLGVK